MGIITRRELLQALTAGAMLSPWNSATTPERENEIIETDICLYGGTSAAVAAAVEAARLGKWAVIVEPGQHLGGMTSGGLGETDIGHKGAIGGVAREFYTRVREHYLVTYGSDSKQLQDCVGGFRFEPHVAEQILKSMVAEARTPILCGHRLRSVKKRGNHIEELTTEKGARIRAKVFIDTSYEGDLVAKAGVSYTVGREANAQYSETLNGVYFGHPNHNFKVPVDPFVKEGDPSSGLLKTISADTPGEQGQGDHRVQAYCFRMCMTNVPENRLPFPKPKGYDRDRYTLLSRYISAGVWDVLKLSKPMPNGKTDTNNFGAFSMDNIGMNYRYPNGDYRTRERIWQDHVTYQQGLMWFLSNDERVPTSVRSEVGQWGLCKDEFQDTGGWPHQLYVREARRMVSAYVMTEHNCRGKTVAGDSVGLAAYTMDSHNCQRIARMENGRWTARNEGNVEIGGFPPYPISYRSMVPHERECANLLVPVCLSASHIAYGSIRMEPVFMVLGQSAATAATLAIDSRQSVQQVDTAPLRKQLEKNRQILAWR
jgi:hypothetical protein